MNDDSEQMQRELESFKRLLEYVTSNLCQCEECNRRRGVVKLLHDIFEDGGDSV